MIEYIIVLALLVGAFIAGMKTSDRYHRQAPEELKYALQKQYVRLVSGSDADDPVQPYVNRAPIDESFMRHLHKHGKATKQIS